jgi:hypothetical protein
MIVAKTITQFSQYFPAQWDGETDNGKEIYIRYRGGNLRVFINDQLISKIQYGGQYAGCMITEEMVLLTKDIIDWGQCEIA